MLGLQKRKLLYCTTHQKRNLLHCSDLMPEFNTLDAYWSIGYNCPEQEEVQVLRLPSADLVPAESAVGRGSWTAVSNVAIDLFALCTQPAGCRAVEPILL